MLTDSVEDCRSCRSCSVAVCVLMEGSAGLGAAAGAAVEGLVYQEVTLSTEHLARASIERERGGSSFLTLQHLGHLCTLALSCCNDWSHP